MACALVYARPLQNASLRLISEKRGKNLFADAGANLRVPDWKHDFAPLKKITGHPVGASAINLFLAAVHEVEDATVLKESSDDGPDADVFAQALYPWAESTDAAHYQINWHACLRRGVKRLDNSGLEKRVHLCDDPGRATCRGMLRFAM